MSLNVPIFQVIVNNSTDLSANVKSFWCSDEELNVGMGQFQIILAENQGVFDQATADTGMLTTGNFPAFGTEQGLWQNVAIKVNGQLIFKGLIEKIQFDTPNDIITLTGYSYAAELANLMITKDYSGIGNAGGVNGNSGDFILDVLTKAGKTLQLLNTAGVNFGLLVPPYPTANTTPGNIKRKTMHDIIREVSSTTGYAATVNTSGTINYFNPLDGNHTFTTSTTLQSVMGYHATANTVKIARSIRDIHEVKNYFEFQGAAQGADPRVNGLTPTSPSPEWTMNLNTTITGIVNTSNYPTITPQDVTNSIEFDIPVTQQAPGLQIPLVFNFKSTSQIYKIKSDVDITNYRLNLLFNNKATVNGYARIFYAPNLPVNGIPNLEFTFTDQNGAMASSSFATIQLDTTPPGPATPWVPFSVPVPNPADYFARTQANYVYTAGGGFMFSSISNITINVFSGNGTQLSSILLSNVYFACQPIYVTPPLTNLGTPIYGERDQEVTGITDQFTNQIDLQAYGDSMVPKFQNPMLRVTATALIDPAQTFLKAGWVIPLNIPRWGYTVTQPSSWRILSVRWEYGSKGVITKLDLTPAVTA